MMFKKAGLGGKARGLLFMEGEASSLGVFFFFTFENFICLCQVLVMARGIFDLHCGHVGSSSLTRDQTWAPCIGRTKS